jgi:hypothetical protein
LFPFPCRMDLLRQFSSKGTERYLYQLLRQQLPNATLVSIAYPPQGLQPITSVGSPLLRVAMVHALS